MTSSTSGVMEEIEDGVSDRRRRRGRRRDMSASEKVLEDSDTREEVIQQAISQTWVVPDGGYGWVVMVCSLMISVIVDGVTYTFGIFLKDLEAAFQEPKSTITLASSLQVGLYLISGPLVSALTNRFGCRPVIIVGSVIAGFSFVLSSFSQTISVLIFTYGIIGGIGFGMMYLPSVVAVSIFFDKKRALATGIAVCGSGIGTFALAPLTKVLLVEYNWRWTLMLLGAIVFNGIICGALIRPLDLRVVDRHAKKNDDIRDKEEEEEEGEEGEGEGDGLGVVAVMVDENKPTGSYPRHEDNRNAIPESIPLITLTADNHTTLLVEPTPKAPAPASHQTPNNIKFFSSTPNFSSGSTEVSKRKNYSSPHSPSSSHTTTTTTIAEQPVVVKGRKRANTLDTTNAFPRPLHAKPPAVAPRQLRPKAPMGLAFIGVSDIHLNRIRDDVALPLSRRDLHRSMARMDFGEVMGDVERMKSQESLASRMSFGDDVSGKRKGVWGCLPESARDTLEEMLNFSIFDDKRYWFIIAGNFLCMLGFYVPFVYIPGRATEIGVSEDKTAYLISIIGFTNLIGRVATGVLVNYLPIDPVLVTSVALALCGVVTILCPLCETYATLIIISAIFGLSVAAYISLCSILLCELLGVRNLTNAFGYVILFRGMACIVGPPIAGALIDATGQFDPAFFVGGTMIVLGAISHFFLLTPCLRSLKPA